jgi:hypothetical protein
MEIKDIYSWSGKSLAELSLNDLSKLEFILDHMPDGIDITLNVGETTFDNISDYIEQRTNEFFNTTREDYERIVGTCFINEYKTKVLKVVGLPDVDDDSNNESNFLFEQYEKWSDGTWHNKDYIWLQETAHEEHSELLKDWAEKYKKYCLTPQTEINLNAEGMYMLGKDGNLYSDYSCGGDYYVFKPMKLTTFELIREEAIEQDGEYSSGDET